MSEQSTPESPSKQDLIQLLREQIALENMAIEQIQKTVRKSKNTILRLLLETIQTDATKHKKICQAAIDMVSGMEISVVEKYELIDATKKHLKLENNQLTKIREAIEKTDDPNTRGLLRLIASDENKHHESLKSLINHLETIEDKGTPKLGITDTLKIFGSWLQKSEL